MLGAYFLGAIIIPIASPESTWILTVLWEIAAPNAFLVSCVVTFVIWPETCNSPTGDTSKLSEPRTILMHNANIAMVACEMYVAESFVRPQHVGFAPLLGILYVIFSWWLAPRIQPQSGPQYLYNFLDTTLRDSVVMSHYIGLVICLMLFHVVVATVCTQIDDHDPDHFMWLLVLVLVACNCKFKDNGWGF